MCEDHGLTHESCPLCQWNKEKQKNRAKGDRLTPEQINEDDMVKFGRIAANFQMEVERLRAELEESTAHCREWRERYNRAIEVQHNLAAKCERLRAENERLRSDLQNAERDAIGLVTLLRAHLSDGAWDHIKQTKPAQALQDLESEREHLREALRQVQWSGGGFIEQGAAGGAMCPLCDQTEKRGHSPDCLVGMALGEGD